MTSSLDRKRSNHAFDIPSWVNWIAQDEDGTWWGYTVEPLRNDHGWYENEVGRYQKLGLTLPSNWINSLTRVQCD